MDPLRSFITTLQDALSDMPDDVMRTVETRAREVFARFELVPKHEYEAHMAVLASLEAQVAELEQRLQALEESA